MSTAKNSVICLQTDLKKIQMYYFIQFESDKILQDNLQCLVVYRVT
jgi:hypothetical protein